MARAPGAAGVRHPQAAAFRQASNRMAEPIAVMAATGARFVQQNRRLSGMRPLLVA